MTAQEAVRRHREAMNRGCVATHNNGISDRYLGVFCLGNAGTHEIYNATVNVWCRRVSPFYWMAT